MDFTQWTRQDFLDFDNRRKEVFQPTQEEIAEQNILNEQYKIDTINSKLSIFGMTKPEIVTKEFVLQLLESMDAKQFVGEDLSGWIDNQIILFGDLETAFDDLVVRYL